MVVVEEEEEENIMAEVVEVMEAVAMEGGIMVVAGDMGAVVVAMVEGEVMAVEAVTMEVEVVILKGVVEEEGMEDTEEEEEVVVDQVRNEGGRGI